MLVTLFLKVYSKTSYNLLKYRKLYDVFIYGVFSNGKRYFQFLCVRIFYVGRNVVESTFGE